MCVSTVADVTPWPEAVILMAAVPCLQAQCSSLHASHRRSSRNHFPTHQLLPSATGRDWEGEGKRSSEHGTSERGAPVVSKSLESAPVPSSWQPCGDAAQQKNPAQSGGEAVLCEGDANERPRVSTRGLSKSSSSDLRTAPSPWGITTYSCSQGPPSPSSADSEPSSGGLSGRHRRPQGQAGR